MDNERKKQLREQYANRRPDMGVICWQSGDSRWVEVSTDAAADYNCTSFQLQFGSWPNREMQQAYNKNPGSFQWSLARKLDYKEVSDDHHDDLQLLLLEYLDAFPDAKPMRPGRRFK